MNEKRKLYSKVRGGAPHNEACVLGERLREHGDVSGMDKGEACEVEEEKRKDESHGLLQVLVRNTDFIIVKERCQATLCRDKN